MTHLRVPSSTPTREVDGRPIPVSEGAIGPGTPPPGVDTFGRRAESAKSEVFDPAASLLPSVTQASSSAIAGLESRITDLAAEIQTLEAENQLKSAAASQLVHQIELRKREIERQRENKRTIGIFGALFGMPMVAAVSLIKMYEDDATLRTLSSDLAKAQSDQKAIANEIEAHRDVRTKLEVQLATLRKAADQLQDAISVEDPKAKSKGHLGVARAAGELERLRKLEANLRTQVSLLEQIRDSAKAIGLELDVLVGELSLQLALAQKMVETSEQSLFDLIKLVTAKDPEAAAQKWLQKKVASRTEALMEELGLSLAPFIRRLVADAFPGQEDSAAAKLLRKQLGEALRPKPTTNETATESPA